MPLLIATDTWHPEVNGVVRAVEQTVQQLRQTGRRVEMITPGLFRTLRCPTYPELRLAVATSSAFARRLEPLRRDVTHVHIATEGPIGWLTRQWCRRWGLAFTSSFHTRFPDYVAMRAGVGRDLVWRGLTGFHNLAQQTMVATRRLGVELRARGIRRVHHCPLGVDTSLFTPDGPTHPLLAELPGPVRLYVGRVAVEKNLTALLESRMPGSLVIVGEGPDRATLEARYPHARFLGGRFGAERAALYRSADVFVFPSRSETLGLVMLEALASGTPVAAYPVPGPLDVLGERATGLAGGMEPIGALHGDLDRATRAALRVDRAACVREARRSSWARCTEAFVRGLVPAARGRRVA